MSLSNHLMCRGNASCLPSVHFPDCPPEGAVIPLKHSVPVRVPEPCSEFRTETSYRKWQDVFLNVEEESDILLITTGSRTSVQELHLVLGSSSRKAQKVLRFLKRFLQSKSQQCYRHEWWHHPSWAPPNVRGAVMLLSAAWSWLVSCNSTSLSVLFPLYLSVFQ